MPVVELREVRLDDPLPSWRRSGAKSAILDLIDAVTAAGSPDFVPPASRIAVFDHDGTLWAERPIPFQAFFAQHRLAAVAGREATLRDRPPYKAFVENDLDAIASFGKREVTEFILAVHAGMTTEEFNRAACAWLRNARHPELGRRFVDCVYQPQLELLEHLRANHFKTFIVSGGGLRFIRAFADAVYGIPPEQVIGSSERSRVELQEGRPVVLGLPEMGSFDDRDEKVINIDLHIGMRPVIAFGNSDGDLRMLQYATDGEGCRLALLLQHDDAEREFAYDRNFRLNPLDQALKVADARGWPVVSMKNDWTKVFRDENGGASPGSPLFAGTRAI